jgi:hypothetical protein
MQLDVDDSVWQTSKETFWDRKKLNTFSELREQGVLRCEDPVPGREAVGTLGGFIQVRIDVKLLRPTAGVIRILREDLGMVPGKA